MAASLMVVVLLVLFLFIPACIALFMSGRSLLLISPGAVACRQAAVAVAFAGLSARGWSESMGMGAASLIFYVIGLHKTDGVKQNTHNGREKNES
jgi:hypothetical protein